MSNGIIRKFDKLIVKSAKWKHIPYSETRFMYLNPFIYKGKDRVLDDGTVIAKGDLVAELHIDNTNLKGLNTNYPSLLRLLQGELKALQQCYKEGTPQYSEIKGIYGISVFYDIAHRQRFSILEVDNPLKRFFGSIWENILRLSLKNDRRKSRKKFVFAKECWLSKNTIMEMQFKERKRKV